MLYPIELGVRVDCMILRRSLPRNRGLSDMVRISEHKLQNGRGCLMRTLCTYRTAVFAGFLFFLALQPVPLFAQDDKPEGAQPQATEKTSSVLLRLAVKCSKDIAAVPDCRSITTNEKQEYIILKDNATAKPQGFLLIPVQPVTGVDD